MIYERLGTGAENARTARELAADLRTSTRVIGQMVERERRAGRPICANTQGAHKGYFIPANRQEMRVYCNRLRLRAGEIFKTRAALMLLIDTLPDEGAGRANDELHGEM